ncbi:7386_t:CDS:2 [Entrophospora sp. SA101]|nr:7386_t:CDS:2 [Entrophospora sp. SA101]
MEKNSKDDKSLQEIIQQKFPAKKNEYKNNCFYYSSENISVNELSKILALSEELLADYCRSVRIKLQKQKERDFSPFITEYLTTVNHNAQLQERPPIISIMGHIDHGKTTLLDTIRQTNLQRKEAGGITQKITVSQIEFHGQKLTLLDTPGHNDFIRLRQRGVSLTDIVVLIIDARDGIMTQTEEIINYLHQYKLPVIVFINHKKPAETDNEKKESVNHLMENALLLTDCQANHQGPANGVVVDSYLHPQLGATVMELLIQGGRLKEKDDIFCQGKLGKIKILKNIHDQKVTEILPGDLAKVIGCDFTAELGEKFVVINNERAKKVLEKELINYSSNDNKLIPPATSSKKKNINLFLTADSQNSLESLTNLVQKKSPTNLNFSLIYTAIGNLHDSDLELARVTQSTILSFGLPTNSNQEKLIKENNIPFFNSRIIYEIEQELDNIIAGCQEKREVEKLLGTAEVKKVIHFSKSNIAGCQVVSGKISRNKLVYVLRGKVKEKIFTGEIKSLESKNKSESEVMSGQECGIVLKGFDKFQEGDKIISFQIVVENVNEQ